MYLNLPTEVSPPLPSLVCAPSVSCPCSHPSRRLFPPFSPILTDLSNSPFSPLSSISLFLSPNRLFQFPFSAFGSSPQFDSAARSHSRPIHYSYYYSASPSSNSSNASSFPHIGLSRTDSLALLHRRIRLTSSFTVLATFLHGSERPPSILRFAAIVPESPRLLSPRTVLVVAFCPLARCITDSSAALSSGLGAGFISFSVAR